MKKKYLIIILIILLIIGITSLIFLFKPSNDNDIKKLEEPKIKETKITPNSIEDNSKELEKNETNVEVVDENKSTGQVTTKKETQEPKKETNTSKSNSNNNVNNNKTNNTKQNEETKKVEPKETTQPVVTESKNDNPWDRLGISEYDYYNKPMYSWEKVDFKVSDYGSKGATEKACEDYGYAYIETHDGAFSCNNVTSYSGAYLGEYFKYNSMD